jgi:hypothetical protein
MWWAVSLAQDTVDNPHFLSSILDDSWHLFLAHFCYQQRQV